MSSEAQWAERCTNTAGIRGFITCAAQETEHRPDAAKVRGRLHSVAAACEHDAVFPAQKNLILVSCFSNLYIIQLRAQLQGCYGNVLSCGVQRHGDVYHTVSEMERV